MDLIQLPNDVVGNLYNPQAVRQPYRVRIRRNYENTNEFRQRFRLTPMEVEQLIQHIGPFLPARRQTRITLTVHQRVICALRFYASNDYYYNVQDTQGTSRFDY
jgi:hypothetical protein